MNDRALEIASIMYDGMDKQRRKRVMHAYGQLFKDPEIEIRVAFILAVSAEITLAEREMLLMQSTDGTA